MTQPATSQARQSRLVAVQDRLDFANKLQALTNKIHATDNISQIMLDLAPEICELFQCERLTLYVFNKEHGALVSKVKTGIDSNKDLVLPVNRQSIAGYVALTRSTVRINNLDDPEELRAIDPELHFFHDVDLATGFKSKQMLVAPLLQGVTKELVGVLQLINHWGDGRFDKIAEEGLETLSTTLALAFSQRIKTGALLPKRHEADWRPNAELAKGLSRATCTQYQWLPWSKEQNTVVVVTTAPDNRIGIDHLHRCFPYSQILLRFTTRTDFNQMLDRYFPGAK